MKRIVLVFGVTLFRTVTFCQAGADIKLPIVTPPSPEAAAINKNGQLSVGLITGGAQAGIPLYDMKIGGLTIPIALNYASNGTKVDEIPSREGMNWTLSPTGVVSRIMHGAADDQTPRQQPYSTFPTYNDSIYPYLHVISQSLSTPANSFETEPDEFRFNAPGLSGKFIIGDTGNIIQIPYSNLKIQVIGGPWDTGAYFSQIIITNTEGVKYYFGGSGAIENTTSISNGQYAGSVHNVRTAFYLKKIQFPNGDNVQFNYSAITFSVTTGRSNTLSHVYQISSFCADDGCTVNSVDFKEDVSDIVYQSVYLTSIISSRGDTASFTYETRPDNSDDKRVKSITITGGDFSKTYYLDYIFPSVNSTGYSQTIGDYQKRYFLSRVAYTVPKNDGTSAVDTLKYTLLYQEPDELAPRLSYAQDTYGYYNGIGNSTLLIPYVTPYGPGSTTYASADRSSHFQYAVKGMLTKIIFPTGGYQEFEYESNSYNYPQLASTAQSAYVIGSGNTSGGQYQTLTYYSSEFTITRDQEANFNFQTFANPGCTSSCDPTTGQFATYAILDVTNSYANVTNGIGYYSDHYPSENFNVQLYANHVYEIKITVSGLQYAASAELTYDNVGTPTYISSTTPTSGVRVKSVTNFDPVSMKYNHAYYSYSGGIFIYEPVYAYNLQTWSSCPSSQNGQTRVCSKRIVSSTPQNDLYLFDGLPWAYNTVTESDDPNFANGGIEHHFMAVADNDFGTNYYSEHPILMIPRSTKTFLQGYEFETNYLNKNGDTVKRVLNFYHVDSTVNIKYRAITARERTSYLFFGLPSTDPGVSADGVGGCYDINSYEYISNWIQMDSTVTIDYSGATKLKSKTTYSYGSAANTQPIKTETVNSKGETIANEFKYPTDSSGTSPYSKMVSNNIISPVIETKTKNNSTTTGRMRTKYNDWYPSSSHILIAPQTVYTQKGSASEESRMQYYAYDDQENILEVAKESGQRISYIWDYSKRFPIAEFKNASIGDSIAYTSFEADGKGYWQFSGTPISESFQPTGNHCYNLSNGNITRNVSSSKTYYVTYWKKDSSGTVSVNSTTATSLISRNGWTCYQHVISSASTITVSGSAKIDELRLYPTGSFVTSYTYRPFVGISSQNTPNNQIGYYEYDAAARLLRIRDADRNIVKRYEYKYGSTIYPCTDTAASWVSTGAVRCVKTNDHYNNNTGVQEYEQKNMNNCSPYYLQSRWLSNGTQSACAAISCSGADKRVINGVCTTGTKVLVSSLHISSSSWQCTYHYVWSDGYVGDNFSETHSTRCANNEQ